MPLTELLGLNKEQALQRALAISQSDYFREYSCKGHLETNCLTVTQIGGWNQERVGFSTLGDVHLVLEGILNATKEDPHAQLYKFNLSLSATDKIRNKIGFTDADGDLSPNVTLGIYYNPENSSFNVNVFSSQLDRAKSLSSNPSESAYRKTKRKYDAWRKEVVEEIAKCWQTFASSS